MKREIDQGGGGGGNGNGNGERQRRRWWYTSRCAVTAEGRIPRDNRRRTCSGRPNSKPLGRRRPSAAHTHTLNYGNRMERAEISVDKDKDKGIR